VIAAGLISCSFSTHVAMAREPDGHGLARAMDPSTLAPVGRLVGSARSDDGVSVPTAHAIPAMRISAYRLAAAITGAGKPSVRRAAVREALSLGGIAITRDLTRNIVAGAAPTAPERVMAFQVPNMAAELGRGGDGGGVTLVQLERGLRDLGVPLRPGPPGSTLREFFQVWIRGARTAPGDPQSFTPLLISELMLRKSPRVDLAAGAFNPGRVRFSALELDLFIAAFFRGLPSPVAQVSRGRGVPLLPRAIASSETATPCSDALEALDKPLGWGPQAVGGKSGWDELIRDEGKKLLRQAMSAVSAAGGGTFTEEQFDQFMLGVSVLSEVINTQALYANLEIKVVPQYDALHAPLERPNVRSASVIHFVPLVQIDEAQWDAYQKELESSSPAVQNLVGSLRDCLRQVGVPAFLDLEEIAKRIPEFYVKWRLEAVDRVARIDEQASNFSSFHTHKLALASPTAALAKNSPGGLAVDVLPVRETKAVHEHGCLVEDPVTARAELDLNVPPELRTFKRVMTGQLQNLPDSVVELTFGMFRAAKFVPAHASTIVQHHDIGHESGSMAPQAAGWGVAASLQCQTRRVPVVEADVTITSQLDLSWNQPLYRGHGTYTGSAWTTAPVRVLIYHDAYSGNEAGTRGGWWFVDPKDIRKGADLHQTQDLAIRERPNNSPTDCNTSIQRRSGGSAVLAAYDSKRLWIGDSGWADFRRLRCASGEIPESFGALDASTVDGAMKSQRQVPVPFPSFDALRAGGADLEDLREGTVHTAIYGTVHVSEQEIVTIVPVCSYLLGPGPQEGRPARLCGPEAPVRSAARRGAPRRAVAQRRGRRGVASRGRLTG
jgi:hypothetical protein